MWACDYVPCECVFEKWISLSDNGAIVRARLTNNRQDQYAFAPFPQELPAVYVNAGYRTAVFYNGSLPWTNDNLSFAQNPVNFETGERWVALVNDSGWGLGLFLDDVYSNAALPNIVPGPPVPDPEHQNPTGYINANRLEILDNNIVYEFTFSIVLGQYSDIRRWSQDRAFSSGLPPPMKGPSSWFFGGNVNPRRGFVYSPLVRDQVSSDCVSVIMSADDLDPQVLAPTLWWEADAVPALNLTAQFNVNGVAQLFFSTFAFPFFSPDRVVNMPVVATATPVTYTFQLAQVC